MHKRYKSSGWQSVSFTRFEELTFWLLHREGFFNITWYGEAGSDKGRDILCERTILFGTRILLSKCIVQCKRYEGHVSRTRLYEDLLKASEFSPDVFIIATSGVVGASTKDWLAAKQDHRGLKIVIWERTDLEIMLARHQDLRFEYLGIPPESEFFFRYLLNEESKMAVVNKVSIGRGVQDILENACNLAFRDNSPITTAHLLFCFLMLDEECTRTLFRSRDLDATALAGILEIAFARNNPFSEVRAEGLKGSLSFKLTLETSVRILEVFGIAIMSERIILLAILLQSQSATVRLLQERVRINREALIDGLLEKFFSRREANLIFAAFEGKKVAYDETYTVGTSLRDPLLTQDGSGVKASDLLPWQSALRSKPREIA